VKILISGATGFIGSKLLSQFSELNHEIAIHVRKKPDEILPNVIVFSGDIINFSSQIKDFSPQYVFHLAGSSIYPSSILDEQKLWESNVLYSNTLISILQDIPNLVFVNFTTSLAYDQGNISPYTYYALTKANFIQSLFFYTRRSSIRVFNLILYSVYGNGDQTKRAFNYIIDSLDAPKAILMSPGEQQLDFVHVDDVVSLCEQLLEQTPFHPMEDIHVGTGRGITLKQAATLIQNISQQHVNIEFGAIPYRVEEKMVNIAPIDHNRFWKSIITFEEGIVSLLKNTFNK
jgi:CDP-paratose synthetase